MEITWFVPDCVYIYNVRAFNPFGCNIAVEASVQWVSIMSPNYFFNSLEWSSTFVNTICIFVLLRCIEMCIVFFLATILPCCPAQKCAVYYFAFLKFLHPLQTLIITNVTHFFSGHLYSTDPMSKSYSTPVQKLLLTTDWVSVALFGGAAANQFRALLASVIMVMCHSFLLKISWSIWLNALLKTKHTSSSLLLPVWTELL